MKNTSSVPQEKTIEFLSQWPHYFGAVALISTSAYIFTASEQLFAVLASLLFGALIYAGRPFWTIYGKTGGVANTITGLRVAGIISLLYFQQYLHAYVFLVLGILILVADGLDGYYARKYNTVSEFGDFFDKETDAFFVLAFCIIILEQQLLGIWVIIPAILRYAFVLVLYLFRIEHIELEPSFRRRFVGMWFMGTIMGCFVLPEAFYTTAMIFASTMLAYSFMKDFYLMLKQRDYQG